MFVHFLCMPKENEPKESAPFERWFTCENHIIHFIEIIMFRNRPLFTRSSCFDRFGGRNSELINTTTSQKEHFLVIQFIVVSILTRNTVTIK